MKLHDFPAEIYHHIRDYLLNYSLNCDDNVFLQQLDCWRYFLNVSKAFRNIKKDTNYLVFWDDVTENYLEQLISFDRVTKVSNLAVFIDSQLKLPRRQLSLKLEGLTSALNFNLTTFPWQCNKVSFKYCRGLTDVSFLCQVPYVSCYRCFKIIDISPFQNCVSVDLSYTDCVVNNSSIHLLAKVKILRLDYCLHLSDVSSLSKVYELSLQHCSSLCDISMLGNVHKLDISFCSRITDISTLSHILYLNIAGLKGIKKGLSSTLTLKHLTVSESTISQLKAIKDPTSTIITLFNDISIDSLKKYKVSRFLHLQFSSVTSLPSTINVSKIKKFLFIFFFWKLIRK
jgi:hypothetical protein